MFGTRALVPLTAALTLALPASTAAQQPVAINVDSIRALLIRGLEQHKLMDIAFAQAIPDSAVRWAPTPEVRDFAEQIEHIIMDHTNHGSASAAYGAELLALLADTWIDPGISRH